MKFIVTTKYLLVLVVLSLFSCKKFIDIETPQNQLNPDLVFTDEATATGAVVGIYGQLWDEGFWSAYLTSLMSDEQSYVATDDNFMQFYENNLLPDNYLIAEMWNNLYNCILSANTVIEQLPKAKTLPTQTTRQLEGEARFIRALCNFYLVNLFGDIPLIINSNYQINRVAPRVSSQTIYNQINEDLLKSKELLVETYVGGQKVRPNKAVATAFLARVYLYQKNWNLAEKEASAIINSGAYNLLPITANLGNKNNSEVIFQIYPMQPGINTYEGLYFTPGTGTTFSSGSFLSNSLVSAFEHGDLRLVNWVGNIVQGGQTNYYSFKYKVWADPNKYEYPIYFRLAEQYLIRAEARTRKGDYLAAQQDLNIIRNRAGLPNTTAITETSLLSAIEQERRVELFTEVGHRWFDLKRTGRIDAVLNQKPNWKSTDALFPIPTHELLNNPNMTQNAGY